MGAGGGPPLAIACAAAAAAGGGTPACVAGTTVLCSLVCSTSSGMWLLEPGDTSSALSACEAADACGRERPFAVGSKRGSWAAAGAADSKGGRMPALNAVMGLSDAGASYTCDTCGWMRARTARSHGGHCVPQLYVMLKKSARRASLVRCFLFPEKPHPIAIPASVCMANAATAS